jgi:hypothetical protein
MRAAPALLITVGRFEVWRSALAALAASAAAATSAWAASHFDASGGGWFALAGAGLGAVTAWKSSARHAISLRWDGTRWHVGADGRGGDELPLHDLRVMADFGELLLLRLWGESTLWVPVQRLGHESSWHLLRCAVYSPRPAATTTAPADSVPPP